MKNLIILFCAVILFSSCGKDKIEKVTYMVFIGVGPWSSLDPSPVYKITATGETDKNNLTGTLSTYVYEFEKGKTIKVTATRTQGTATLNMIIYRGTDASPNNAIYNSFGTELSTSIIVK